MEVFLVGWDFLVFAVGLVFLFFVLCWVWIFLVGRDVGIARVWEFLSEFNIQGIVSSKKVGLNVQL